MSHDDKGNGNGELFAALNVDTGEVLPGHTHRTNASAFFNVVDANVPCDLRN